MLRKLSLSLLAVLAVVLVACGGAPASMELDEAAISDAVIAGLGAESDVVIDRVEVEEVVGDYARALAIPVDENTFDNAYVFLQRQGAEWSILNYGTAFGPEDYERFGIPEELWLGN